MTQVRGKITKPDGSPAVGSTVQFRLVGANRAFVSTDDETVLVTQAAVAVDGTGAYLIDLPGNTLLNPPGTRWEREIVGAANSGRVRDQLIVPPSGGPYWEEDILAAPLTPIPTTEPSNEKDYAERTTGVTGLAVNSLNLVPVPALVVTVPDLTRPVMLFSQLWMDHSAANAQMGAAIAPVGSTLISHQRAIDTAFMDTAGLTAGATPIARLPAHSPGDFQAFVFGEPGTIDVSETANDPSWINVLAV